MPKTKISEFSSTPASNTDIDSINLAEGCAPSGINDAIRELMAQLKDWQSGTSNDPYVVGSSGSLTLNQGTANGVAYLNGSKVVTSGSALTFDGTTFAQTGANGIPIRIQELASVPTSQTAAYIGVSTSAFPGSNNGDLILAPRTSGGNLIKFYTGNGTSAERYSIDSVGVAIWSVSGSEQMRLTSTGLGIGTSSPSEKLHVNSGAGNVPALFESTDPIAVVQFKDNNSTGFNAVGAQTNDLIFYSNGALNMRLDPSGNLGLGVSPSAWFTGGGYKVMQIGAGMALDSGNDFRSRIASNGFVNSSGDWRYLNTGFASNYTQTSGQHQFYTAASGTAGNAITFTQAMSLLASGNLLVGTTSTIGSSLLQSYNGIDVRATDNYNASPNIRFHTAVNTTGGIYCDFWNSTGSTVGTITRSGTSSVAYNTSSDYRLKNITGSITTSGAYIDSLNPVEGTWKADGSTFVGLIAHEVQEVSRTNVATGTKDGEKMQAMDYSSAELIANLIAEVKSLRQRVATLEAK